MPSLISNINDRSLKNLTAINNKQTAYTDPDRKGFCIRVNPGGSIFFFYRYKLKGNGRRYSLGSYPTVSLKEARLEWAKCSEMVAQGRDIWLGGWEEQEKEITVSSVFDDWFVQEVIQKRKDPEEVKRNCQKWILNPIGKYKIQDINTIPHLEKLVLGPLMKKGLVRMPNVIFTHLSQIWRFAEAKGILGTSPYQPFNSMRPPILKENKRNRVLDDQEIVKFWRGIEGLNDLPQLNKLAMKILLLTGVRKNELLTATWDKIDLNDKTWVIEAENSKSGNEWRVALSDLSVDLFKEMRSYSKGNRVCPLGRNTVDQAINRRYEYLGLEKFVPHDLRRTYRTLLARLGVSYHAGEKALNHKLRTGIEETYNKYDYFDERLEGAELVKQHIQNLLS